MDEIKKETDVQETETVETVPETVENVPEVVESAEEAGTIEETEVTESAVESAEETGTVEAVAESTEETGTVETTEATTEVPEVAEENVPESAEDAAEAPEEAVESAAEAEGIVSETEPVKTEPKKKTEKSGKIAIIVGVVVIVVVLACVAFAGIKMGWFGSGKKSGSKVELGDYTQIEVLRSNVDVNDETVESYITQLLSSQQTTQEQTEGVVASGDTLNIDYVGTYADTGEAFEGGTAQGQQLTIGSGTYIDGFEDGLIGKKIGSTVDLALTFPEDFGVEDLNGKAVNFKVTINSKVVTVTPELTDEFVQEYSYNALPEQLNTVDDLKNYAADYIYHYYLRDAMMSDIQRKAKIVSYDEEMEADLMAYSKSSLDYYATMYGVDAETYAQLYGYTSADEYAADEAHYYMDIIMILDQIIKDKKLEVTEEGLDQYIVEYMGRSGYNQYYDLEEFKEQSGEDWLFLFENLEYKYNLVLEALESNVVFVDELSEVPTEAESTEAAPTEAAAN